MRWYEKTWVVVLFLLFFTPVGIFLMWRFKQWNKILKIVLTIFFSATFIFAIFSPKEQLPETPKSAELKSKYDYYEESVGNILEEISVSPEQADEIFIVLVSIGMDDEIYSVNKNIDIDNVYSVNWLGSDDCELTLSNGIVDKIIMYGKAVYPESLVESERLAAEAAEKEAKEKAKIVAKIMDEQLVDFVMNSSSIFSLLQEGILLYEDNNDILSLYSLVETAYESQRNLDSSLRSIRDDDNEDYVDAIEQYIINGQIICDKLMEYLDGGSLDNLTDVQSRLVSSQSYLDDITIARYSFLADQGFTNDEIAAIAIGQDSPIAAEDIE